MLREIIDASELDYSKILLAGDSEPTVPVVVIDTNKIAIDGIGSIRMVGFANIDAVRKTLETKMATFYSRSRKELWTKGESSGNVLQVLGAYTDCDNDTLLLSVVPVGPTCHTGAESCFQLPTIYDGEQ
jgi:phosphoribosyl-AMP cyclohydrolase / phosphoribosyl-ATP pyrophosphohydrolase